MVMAARDMITRHSEFSETKDFIPTPPYATRTLFQYAVPEWVGGDTKTVLDPAAGQGHMVRVFQEYGMIGLGSDLHDHGGSDLIKRGTDFLESTQRADFIITNPPYAIAEPFARKALSLANMGVA